MLFQENKELLALLLFLLILRITFMIIYLAINKIIIIKNNSIVPKPFKKKIPIPV